MVISGGKDDMLDFVENFLIKFRVFLGGPDLIDKILNEMTTVFLIRFKIWPVDNIMEEDADFQNKLISFRQLIESHNFLVTFQVLEHSSHVVVGMVVSPVLTVVFNDDIPPLSAHQMIILF